MAAATLVDRLAEQYSGCSDGEHLVALDALARRLEESHNRLLAALKDVFALMDEGYLVRSMHNDSEPDWAITQFRYVRRLAIANAAIAAAEELTK